MKTQDLRSKSDRPAPQKRLTAEQRRRQLLPIAKKLFSERGFESTTTKAIAAAAGVSEGVIFKHFASKSELYASILDHKAREMDIDAWEKKLCQFSRCEDDEALIHSVVTHILEADRQDPQFRKMMFQAALNRDPLHKITAQRMLPLHEFLSKYIKKRQKKGAFRNFDPRLAAYAIVGVPSYYGHAQLFFGVNDLKRLEDRMALDITKLILDGLRSG
jgi:AcrR family transcriptional regulator